MPIRVTGNIAVYDTLNADFNGISNTGQTNFQKSYTNSWVNVSPVGSTFFIPCNVGNIFIVVPTQNSSIQFDNTPTGVFYSFSILIDSVTNGAFTFTWPATVKWAFGEPTYASNTYTMVNLMYDNGGTYYGSYIPKYGL